MTKDRPNTPEEKRKMKEGVIIAAVGVEKRVR